MRALLFLSLVLAGCGADDAPQRNESRPAATPRARLPELAPPGPDAENASAAQAEAEESADAAEALKAYYRHIETGDYEAAFAMREGDSSESERKRFVANFKAYERYRATVGQPSRPVEAGGWVYAEVPVMIYGSFRGGKPFGSSGSVTLRRPASGGPWRIFVSGGRSRS
jgi:hypothetical protein